MCTILLGSVILGNRSEGQGEWPGERGRASLKTWRCIVELVPTKGNWVLSPKGLSSENLNQGVSRKSSQDQKEGGVCPPAPISRRPGSTGGCMVWPMNVSTRRASERGDTLKRMCFLMETHFLFALWGVPPTHTLLCCFYVGDEGLLLYLDPDPFLWSDSSSFFSLICFSIGLSVFFVTEF